MTTGLGSWIGFPPKVTVGERMLLSQVPEAARGAFLKFLGDRVQYTRSGEPVFDKQVFEEWKRLY